VFLWGKNVLQNEICEKSSSVVGKNVFWFCTPAPVFSNSPSSFIKFPAVRDFLRPLYLPYIIIFYRLCVQDGANKSNIIRVNFTIFVSVHSMVLLLYQNKWLSPFCGIIPKFWSVFCFMYINMSSVPCCKFTLNLFFFSKLELRFGSAVLENLEMAWGTNTVHSYQKTD
jgi:hypothetical protein